MFDSLLDSFVILFVVVDPVGIALLFTLMDRHDGEQERWRTAWRAVGLSTLILIVFFFVGDLLLRSLDVGIPAFRIAGGILLFLLAIDMVFARQSGLRSTTDRERREAQAKEDVSVFPLAFPLIAGPGALTTVLLMAAESRGPLMAAGMIAVVLAVMGLTLLALLLSRRLMASLGETGANVLGRLFGVLLAALAVQFVVDGVQAIVDGVR